MSKKTIIMTELKKLNQNTYYADTTYGSYPRVMVYLVSNAPRKYSNKRHYNKVKYQISYYSTRALDVEISEELWGIIDALEAKNLITTNWKETVTVDEKANTSHYHYWLEVT